MRARILVAFALLVATIAVPRSQTVAPLRVFWVDVEGGGATLIVTPSGESLLVDAGNPGARDPGRIFKTATDAGLKRIDHLVVTHLHGDHFGGVAELSALLPIGTLYENGVDAAPEQERSQRTVPAFQSAKVDKRVVVQPGDFIRLGQTSGAAPIRVRVLAARQKLASTEFGRANAANCRDASPKPVDTSDNANSIVMLFEQGPFRMFLGGDMTWNVEERLVCPEDRVGAVDVYQSVHHGLDLSNNPVLVHTLQPHVVVFNNGARKGFESGAAATVKGTPSVQAIYQLHRSLREGAQNNDAQRIANQDQECKGDGIAMTVTPDGKSYTVSVPSTGHKQTYQTRTR